MIAYFDTSALVPLIIEEPTSETANTLWQAADRVVSASLVYAEARAALAQAGRLERLDDAALEQAVTHLEFLYPQLDRITLGEPLVRRAGELAQQQALRGYDAIHLAAAESARDDDLVVAAGDGALCDAARDIGLHISRLVTVDPP